MPKLPSKSLPYKRRRREVLEGQGWKVVTHFGDRAIYLLTGPSGKQVANASPSAQAAQESVESAHRRGDSQARWFWAETVDGKVFDPPQ